MIGVAVIVVILIAVPSHHASLSYVFGHRANNSGLQRTGMFWFYVLPLGFLLTMYTITGYDASAHVSEETHGADDVGAEGRLAVGLLLGDRRLDRAARDHVRGPRSVTTDDLQGRLPGAHDLQDRAELGRGQGRDPDLDRRAAVLRDGVRHERLADDVRVLARRRRARAQPVAPARPEPDAHVVGAVRRRRSRSIITIPAYFPNYAGYPVAFFAVTSISVIGLYIAYTIPVFLRWRHGRRIRAGPVDARQEVQVDEPRSRSSGSRSAWSSSRCRSHRPACPWKAPSAGTSVNYAPLVDDRRDGRGRRSGTSVSANKTFKGPVRTIDGTPTIADAPVAIRRRSAPDG